MNEVGTGGFTGACRIAEARLYSYRLPYKRAVQWSDTAEDAAEYVLLELTADDGRIGLAEVTIKRTWNGASTRSVMAAVQELFIPSLRAAAPSTEKGLLEYLDQVPENSAAKCLVGTAMAMLVGSSAQGSRGPAVAGPSVVEPSAGALPPTDAGAPGVEPEHDHDGAFDVPLSWAVTRQSPTLMAREAVASVEAHGFRTLKIKGGQGFEIDVAAVREIRSAVGDGVTLTVDANGAYGCETVGEYAKMLAAAGVSVVEDPAPLVADASLKGLVEDSPVPLLIDFPCASTWHARALVAAGCRAINVKPGRYGIPEARRIAALCDASNVRTCLGLFGESLLGTFINLQMVRDDAALTSFLPAEPSFFLMLNEQVVTGAPLIRDGSLRVPSLRTLMTLVDRERLIGCGATGGDI